MVITQNDREEPRGIEARTISQDEFRRSWGKPPEDPPRVPTNKVDEERTKEDKPK